MARGAPPGYPLQVPREARGAFHYYPLPEMHEYKKREGLLAQAFSFLKT
jgi:hypothetical protein